MDQESLHNLKLLDVQLSLAQEAISDKDDYYIKSLDYRYTQKDTEANRQEVFTNIAKLRHKKGAGAIVDKVFKKYDLFTKAELKSALHKKSPGNPAFAFMVKQVKHNILSAGISNAVALGPFTDKVFKQATEEMTKLVHQALPEKVYKMIED